MSQFYQLAFCLAFLLILNACSTVKPETFESFDLDYDNSGEIESEINVPFVKLFISAPFTESDNTEIIPINDVNLPFEDVPVKELQQISEVTVPVVQVHDEKKDVMNKSSEIVIENVGQIDLVEDIQIDSPDILGNLLAIPGENLQITIDKEGWIFQGNTTDHSVNLKNREFANDKTLFLFSFSEEGDNLLEFRLQNLSTGSDEIVFYNIKIEELDENEIKPVVIEQSDPMENISEDTVIYHDIEIALEDEHIPGIIASFDELIDDNNTFDINLMSKAFDLLEFQGGYDSHLLILAEKTYRHYPYDNKSAEMLYKTAQLLVKSGPGQDIEKALGLFKLVRDRFPISIYCDKSEERIRYLERHFMKIY